MHGVDISTLHPPRFGHMFRRLGAWVAGGEWFSMVMPRDVSTRTGQVALGDLELGNEEYK